MKKYANLNLIYVADIDRSVSFYTHLFGFEPDFISPRYVAFRTSEATLPLFALWSGGATPDPKAARFSEIGIMLDNSQKIHDLYATCLEEDTLEIVETLHEDIFGWTFTFRDPDGHMIRICPID